MTSSDSNADLLRLQLQIHDHERDLNRAFEHYIAHGTSVSGVAYIEGERRYRLKASGEGQLVDLEEYCRHAREDQERAAEAEREGRNHKRSVGPPEPVWVRNRRCGRFVLPRDYDLSNDAVAELLPLDDFQSELDRLWHALRELLEDPRLLPQVHDIFAAKDFRPSPPPEVRVFGPVDSVNALWPARSSEILKAIECYAQEWIAHREDLEAKIKRKLLIVNHGLSLGRARESTPAAREGEEHRRHPMAEKVTIDRRTPRVADRALLALFDAPDWRLTGEDLQKREISKARDAEEAARSAYNRIAADYPVIAPYLRFRKAPPPAIYLSETPR